MNAKSSKSAPKLGNLRHLYLVDGSGYIFRAFHALPPMTRSDGTPTNAVFGFSSMLMKLMEDAGADHLAVIFDAGRETFRNKIYGQYKAHRPEPPEELIPQFALIREAVRAFNVPCIELPGYEADDLIATYADQAREMGAEVTIVSSDKDLMQLVREGVRMLDPIKNRPIGPAEVMEKFGVAPEKVVDVQALAGDSTDNVPGVPGIGIKTAAQLIGEYGDLESLLSRAGEIKQPKRRESLQANAELARISKKLVQLDHNVPVPQHADTLDKTDPDPAILIPWLEFQGFKRILPRAREKFGDAPEGAPVPDLSDGVESETQRQARVVAFNEKKSNGQATPAPAKKSERVAKDDLLKIGAMPYETIADAATLELWMAEAMHMGMVTVDTETDSLDELKANLIGVALALPDGRAAYVPIGHRKPGSQGTLDFDGGGAGELLPGQLPLEKGPAICNFRRRRLVLRRQAFDAVDDDRAVERQPVVDPRIIIAPAQPERGERPEQQVARIVAGERPPRPVCSMLARCQPRQRQPRIGIAEGMNRRVPPVGMLGPTRPAQRNEPRTARTIAWRLGSGQRAINFHAAAIGART